ncbi:unnamed protein product [Boreogadus saida]
MTSTNMFQGLDNAAKPSSRVLRPPGGTSSNLFGGYEEDAAPLRRPNHTASSIFAPDEPRQVNTRRSNPPGGKASGIFGDDPAPQARPVGRGSQSSNIFGGGEPAPPSKPKEEVIVTPEPELAVSPQPSPVELKEEEPILAPPASPVEEEEAAAAPLAVLEPAPEATPTCLQDDSGKNHEPHLGPKRRAHNRVLNPPGGKSSVVFY